jgi:hypothetical protein
MSRNVSGSPLPYEIRPKSPLPYETRTNSIVAPLAPLTPIPPLGLSIKKPTIKKTLTYYPPEKADFIDACIAAWRKKALTEKGTSGSHGTVHEIAVNDERYFVKGIQKTSNEEVKNSMENEIEINQELTELLGDYVSKLKGAKIAYNDNNGYLEGFLIYEYLDGVDLFDYIQVLKHSSITNLLTTHLATRLYCSIKKAQVALNELGYIHRDIKPENIFVVLDDKDRFVKCILLDLDTLLTIGQPNNSGAGTNEYMPNDKNARWLSWKKMSTKNRDSYALDIIWTRDFEQNGPPPACLVGGAKTKKKAKTRRLKKTKAKRLSKRNRTYN